MPYTCGGMRAKFVNGNCPTVLIDMDGTKVEWSSRLNRLLLNRDPNFPIVPEGKRVGFDYFWVEGADRDLILDAMNDPELYRELDPIPGAVEAILEMDAEGFDVFICSTPTWTNPGCVQGKLDDVERLLGAEWTKKLILTHDKTLVRGDILIDDKPEITGAHTPVWKHLMFDQDYNRHIDTPHRLTAWSKWREAVAPLLGGLSVAA